MAKMKLDDNVPKQSLLYIGIGIIVIFLFIFVGIFPAKRSMAELDKKTAEVNQRIEEQKILAPFYQAIKARVEQKDPESLPVPGKGKLALSMINTIYATFDKAARTSGVSLLSATPDLSGLGGNFQTLPVNVTLRGDFFKFRKFLINLGSIPYVQHIEEITIQKVPASREFKLKVLVAVG